MTQDTRGVWNLQQVRDQILSSNWIEYDFEADPGEYFVAGSGSFGANGTNNSTTYSSPVQLGGSDWLTSCGHQYYRASANKTTGHYVWGLSGKGELGLNSNTSRSSPTQLPGSWISTKLETDWSMGIKTDGSLWFWGWNCSGQFGNSCNYACDWIGGFSYACRCCCLSSPTQVPGTLWCSHGSPNFLVKHQAAINQCNNLYVWGNNCNGALGIGFTSCGYPTQCYGCRNPTLIPGSWTQVNTGPYGTAAIKSDGTLWVWGNSIYSGTGGSCYRCSPTQIPGTNWTKVQMGESHVQALKSDNTLWSWGQGAYGVHGNNCQIDIHSPLQIPGFWVDIGAGYYQSAGVRTDGTLYTWGYNPYGNLGHNNTTCYSSPVQVPGTKWFRVNGTGFYNRTFRRSL